MRLYLTCGLVLALSGLLVVWATLALSEVLTAVAWPAT
jgi:hypothetical protein